MPTIQHNLPISKGGEHEIDNISVICESCNTSICDNETEEFNNAEVIEKWDKIMLLEKQGIKWFDNPEILNNPVDSQMSVTCQSNVSIGKDRLGKDRLGESVQSAKRFVPPTLDEVKSYCSERNNGIDAQRFLDYYEARGWKIGKCSMKDWKAAVRTWEKSGYNKPKKETSYDLDEWEKYALNLDLTKGKSD